MNIKRLVSLLDGFKNQRIMVLGDFVADEYLFGETSRVSREAPVLILKRTSREMGLGGAGNAAKNLSELGAKVIAVGFVGDDEVGWESLRLLRKAGVNTSKMIIQKGIQTTTKTRIMAGGTHTTQQQILRIDRGEYNQFSKKSENTIINILDNATKIVSAILVSDYQYGVLSQKIISKINAIARSNCVIITVDSRYQMLKFRNITSTTPNEPEVEEALNLSLNDDETALRSSGERILNEIKCDSVLVTRGKKGMALFMKTGDVKFLPIFGGNEVTDVTGAGDTVVAIYTMALAVGGSFLEAAQLANVGGGLVVMKRGAATVTRLEIASSLKSHQRLKRS